MSIIDSLKRLERAGSENSRTTQKLREAAREVSELVEAQVPQNVQLPRGYVATTSATTITTTPALVTNERGILNGEKLHGEYNRGYRPALRPEILQFAADIADGWLDEVAAFLEERAAKNEAATATLEAAKNALQGTQGAND